MALDRRMELAENLESIRATIPQGVHLIVVTKTFPVSDVEILSELGITEFAENRDQEGKIKAPLVPAKWHFQGQLQSNKLRSICEWADVIQTVDSLRYVDLLSKVAQKSKEVFIQVSLDEAGGSEIRGGALPSEINQIADQIRATKNLRLQGLMAVAPLAEEPRSAFSRLAQIHQRFKSQYPDAPYLSAGMSGDYLVAIEHGATHVRLGSSILGSRA